jgi:hypothetical protein
LSNGGDKKNRLDNHPKPLQQIYQQQQKTTTTKKESKKVPGPNTTVAYFFSPDYYALTDKSMKTKMLVGRTM